MFDGQVFFARKHLYFRLTGVASPSLQLKLVICVIQVIWLHINSRQM
jgi:hypothetical protein